MTKKYECNDCDLIFDNFQLKANHIRWNHNDETFSQSGKQKLKDSALLNNEKRFGKYIIKDIICPKCDVIFSVKVRDKNPHKHKKFCNQKCANSRTWTEKQYKLHMDRYNDPNDNYGEVYKSNIGKIHNNKRFSSKIERALAESLLEYGFTRHYLIKTDTINFDIDIISEDKNIWVESDGEYHFTKVHKNHDFDKSKMRDYIQEIEAIKQNKLLIRIDNRKYKSIPKQVEIIMNEIKKWNKQTGKIVKFY